MILILNNAFEIKKPWPLVLIHIIIQHSVMPKSRLLHKWLHMFVTTSEAAQQDTVYMKKITSSHHPKQFMALALYYSVIK